MVLNVLDVILTVESAHQQQNAGYAKKDITLTLITNVLNAIANAKIA